MRCRLLAKSRYQKGVRSRAHDRVISRYPMRLCAESEATYRYSLLAIIFLLPLALVKTLYNRRSPGYLRGLIGEPLREIIVIVANDIEHDLLGEPAMILGK